MGCQTTYSSPITLPTAAAGPAGPAGADGANGVGIKKNTIGTDYYNLIATGDQILKTSGGTAITYTTELDGYAAGDILEAQADLLVTASFLGSITIKFGTSSIAVFSIPTGFVLPNDIVNNVIPLTIKAEVSFVSASSQYYNATFELGTTPVTITKTLFNPCAEDTSGALALTVRCNPSAGTVTCKRFVVTHKEI